MQVGLFFNRKEIKKTKAMSNEIDNKTFGFQGANCFSKEFILEWL